jgi:DeoR/GlpR family transcriptional regulator of sugar metabolism
MNADRRRQRILEEVAIDGRASIGTLAQSLHVSEMTIRRDLTELESTGAIARIHGGAVIPSGSSHEPPFGVRTRLNAAHKNAVAATVGTLLEDAVTLFLDGGSTGVAIAKTLVTRNMTICTPSFRVADVLKSAGGIRLMMTGGLMRPREHSLVGPPAIATIGNHRFDWYVMTVSGIDLHAGCTEWNLDDAAVKQAALESARTIMVAADSTKIGAIAFARLCPIDRLGIIVTNRDGDPNFIDGVQERGVAVHLANE